MPTPPSPPSPPSPAALAPISTVAITGGAGFVGRYMVRELIEQGYTVRALVRDREKAKQKLPSTGVNGKVQLVLGDALDPAKVDELLSGAQACINLIGLLREERAVGGGKAITFRKAHVETTRTLVARCHEKQVRRYIQMSALGVSPNGCCDYQKTKFEGEMIVRLCTLDWTIFRPGLIHGPDSGFIKMLGGILKGDDPPHWFAPYFTRGVEDKSVPLGGVKRIDPKAQPIAVEDVAKAFVGALTNEATLGEVYNLVGSEVLDWPSLLRFMRDELHADPIEPWGVPSEPAATLAMVAEKLGLAGALPFDAGMARMGAQDTTAALEKVRVDLKLEPKPFRSLFRRYAQNV